eukprot:jgi/Psemu1/233891/estExt_Genewise1.C_80142
MNWEPVRSRLTGNDLDDALAAARELREGIEIVHTVEFPLMLSALLPAFSTILATNPNQHGRQHYRHYQLRNTILEIISRMPSNEVLRPHAPHLVAVALDVLIHRRDYEENALLASRIIFDLYKAYKSLPQDYIQPALDFVVSAYKTLPGAVQRSFSFQNLSATSSRMDSNRRPENDPSTGLGSPISDKKSSSSSSEVLSSSKRKDGATTEHADTTDMDTTETGTQQHTRDRPIAVITEPTSIATPKTALSSFHQVSLSPRSNASFRVLTEWPLIVMLMFQLYPKFLKGNISTLIKAMTEALSLRAPAIEFIEQQRAQQLTTNTNSSDQRQLRLNDATKRLYFSRSRELVAAQAKTLSFLTYLLRNFVNELKPYEDRLASNVIAIMSTCPRDLLSTRKELLVATRHLLHSDHFKNGFFRHVDSLLEERILFGWSAKHQHRHRYLCDHNSEHTVLRPLGYAVLSELVHNARNTPVLNLFQISRIVTIFSRVLHDATLPMSTQYTAVKTLLSVLDSIFYNKDRNPQLGRDLMVRIFRTVVEKLSTLHTAIDTEPVATCNKSDADAYPSALEPKHEPLKDKKSMVQIIVVGSKTLIWYINNYRVQRERDIIENIHLPRTGLNNEEVHSGLSKITNSEHALIDQYIVLGMESIKLLKGKNQGEPDTRTGASAITGERQPTDQFRDTLTYFAAAFAALDGCDLRRVLGRRLDVLVEAVKDDPAAIIVPRHLLSVNPATSLAFCSMMLNFLVDRMDHLVLQKAENICFLSPSAENETNRMRAFEKQMREKDNLKKEDIEKTSNAHLQLFERILKSLSAYPGNERALRPHLKRIVSTCLRSSLEKSDVKADNYCMLLRYVFRSISAGKFEESYRELLPLIPNVLNGLFRVLSSTEDTTLRHTLIELVLTIPARLSSLLPHMNLLLRIIVLALKSNSDDLVNLGLRTLEFWVDNLNPEFLFPELSKKKRVFVSLMKALSVHLRPAPYPYGLLTLRLLGKLGGKNRRVLREPIEIVDPNTISENSVEKISLGLTWSTKARNADEKSNGINESSKDSTFEIDLPIQRCLELLKRVSNVSLFGKGVAERGETTFSVKEKEDLDEDFLRSEHVTKLLSTDVGDIDLLHYCRDVTRTTTLSQVKAAIQVLRSALMQILGTPNGSLANVDLRGTRKPDSIGSKIESGTCDMQAIANRLTQYNNEFHTIAMGLMFGCSILPMREKELHFMKGLLTSYTTDPLTINRSLAEFLAQSSTQTVTVGLEMLKHILKLPVMLKKTDVDEKKEPEELERGSMIFFENLLSALCNRCLCSDWSRRCGLYKGIILMVEILGQSWAKRYETEIMNVALYSVKSVPTEMPIAGVKSFEFLVQLCSTLYGKIHVNEEQSVNMPFIVDILSLLKKRDDKFTKNSAGIASPCVDVLQMLINEMASTISLMRAAARFVFEQYFLNTVTKADAKSVLGEHITLIRRVLFSRSLRLLPLQEQVGAVEALAVLVDQVPDLISLEDQHLLAFLSELLKMSSVADGEMTDKENNLIGGVVDKNGFVLPGTEQKYHPTSSDANEIDPSLRPSSLFLRRDCILSIDGYKILIGEELPNGMQLRISSIQLLRSIIRGHPDTFFDAESSTPVGNIRPHIISLLFRSLVSQPIQAVTAAHDALRDVLRLSVVTINGPEGSRSKSRLRKELLQTCIRPVLLNLRDYTRLSTCLLRGLSQLLSLLSTWFNKTLGEKLLDHLQKWTNPSLIKSHKIWKEGEEPDVAAAIVGLFALLPHASNFVDPLVKTTIKLETCLPAYKSRHVHSPYRKSLALYLNKYSQHTVTFFLQRWKTPIYTELFQDIVNHEGSTLLRQYLSGKCSDSILNVSFKCPLAIIRSEKASVTSASPTKSLKSDTKLMAEETLQNNPDGAPPMTIESLEHQLQGFCLIETLVKYDDSYLKHHNGVLRALRWLWRSKGRYLRMQHEESISPRYLGESKALASFLLSYSKNSPNDVDLLFELIRIFLQPASGDFSFIRSFLKEISSRLGRDQKEQIMQRFFALMAGESTEEIKFLSLQLVVYPMLHSTFHTKEVEESLAFLSSAVVQKFVTDVLFHDGRINPCGERLKVGLLQISALFLEFIPAKFGERRNELVKFCWSLLKNDDISCKNWAYLVLCRCINIFNTQQNIILHVYDALLRAHQHEGKDLVKVGLNLLVSALPKRLDKAGFTSVIDNTYKVMFEEGNSVPQLAHVWYVVVRHPEIFVHRRSQLVRYMIDSLSRLGLLPNSPTENRALALSIVELVLSRASCTAVDDPTLNLDKSMVETVLNFLIRLKILLADPKVGTASSNLDLKLDFLLRGVIRRWNGTDIRPAYFEKVVSMSVNGLPDMLTACLEVFLVLAEEDPRNGFLIDNPGQLKSILSACFRYSKSPSETCIREKLETFLVAFLSLGSFADERVVQPVTVWLEKLLTDTDMEYRKNHGQVNETQRQARFRQPASTEESRPEDCAVLFSLRIIKKVGNGSPSFPKIFTSSLVSLLNTIVKKHTLQAATKQKQNGVAYNSQTGTISIREMYPTPISGILQQIFPENIRSPAAGIARNVHGKHHDLSKELKDFDCMLQSAVIILDILGNSDIVYLFSNKRKTLLSLLQSIFCMSNNVQLLLSAVRIVGKWLIAGNSGPLTTKERNNFLLQISSFDFNGLSDLVSQPLADLVCHFMTVILSKPDNFFENGENDREDMITSRSITACLLIANDYFRRQILSFSPGSRYQLEEQTHRPADILWQLFHSDFEGLGGRHWVVVFVEILLKHIKNAECLLDALCRLAHGDSLICQNLMQALLPAMWRDICDGTVKHRVVSAMEAFLSRSFHSQTFKKEISDAQLPTNSIRSFLSSIVYLNPLPIINVDLLVTLAQSYNSWYEVLSILEHQYFVLSSTNLSKSGSTRCDKILLAMRHCYRQLGENKIWTNLALKSCKVPGSSYATSLDIYGKVDKALEAYSGLIDMVESEESTNATSFEMDYWEDRWVNLQQQGQQLEVVSEYARQSKNEGVMLECAWRERDWDSVRFLCSSPRIVAAVESGDPAMKICETLSAVADGKLGDVENLHAQSSQLALYKWQNLPSFSGGSCAHAELLHFFHRLVEIRESGQIMVETNNHSTGKTLPDLKNLLNAWRHRLPNDEEELTVWDEIFTWRAHMFNAITSNFHWSEPSILATLHDRPWTAIRMSTVARKHGMQQTAFLLLNRITDNRAMDVSDVYLKLREQILLFNNPGSEKERNGGLYLINTTNLSYFDSLQKSELFRLKAIFLSSLRQTSKSNLAYCHSVQICPSHTKSWISWGGLCSSLGTMTEKKAEQARAAGTDNSRESRTDSTKKVAQYLAQAMGCFIEAIQIDPNEKSRIHLPRCLWMLTKDGSSPGVLCQTLENRGTKLPSWVWLPWMPQLLTGLCRIEGRTIRVILSRVIKAYPQAAYYSLRAFYLERRDVERAKGGHVAAGQHMASVAYAEEMMSTLRRSHASLWSSLEAILEELIVKFRPSYEEELLATISALLERAESHAEKQSLPDEKRVEDEEAMVAAWSKTLSRIAAKFFRETDSTTSSNRRDERVKKTADFKRKYKADFELDFKVTTPDGKQGTATPTSKAQFRLAEYITKLQAWKEKLEIQVARTPRSLPLIESSHSLAMFHGSFPNLWPGSCDTRYSYGNDRSPTEDTHTGRTPPSTSSSAATARKAALGAALAAANAAAREGVGGEYGGGSAAIEIPGQYCPNSSATVDIKPCPELHAKLIKFEPNVEVLRRNDQLVRRCGMIGSDGRTYKFLLQFAIPYWTRTDERAAQTSYIIEKFLRQNIISARNYINLQPTAAIPVAQRLRMTPDPDCRVALDEVWRTFGHETSDAKSASHFFSKELKRLLKTAISHDASEDSKRKAEKEVRLKLYVEICGSMVDDRILLRYLMKIFNGPEPFFLFRRAFAVQLAANSLLQYVFSVAERTPQRFVILQSSGKMLSPDFRISYSNQGFIEGYNQVPFRMTPNIQRALGEHYIQGIFVRSMTMIAGAVKEHNEEFDPILRLLMRDDILAWYSKSLAKTDSKTQELERQLIERVSKNVHTLQSRFSECAPYENIKTSDCVPLDQRVNELVQTAINPENLCMTRIGYQGWL